MLRLKAERRSLAKVSGASAPESRTTKTTDNSYHSTRTAPSNAPVSDRKPRVSSSFHRGLRFTLAFDIFLAAFVVAVAYLVGWMAFHVPTFVVILGGLILIGLVVVRGAASS